MNGDETHYSMTVGYLYIYTAISKGIVGGFEFTSFKEI